MDTVHNIYIFMNIYYMCTYLTLEVEAWSSKWARVNFKTNVAIRQTGKG